MLNFVKVSGYSGMASPFTKKTFHISGEICQTLALPVTDNSQDKTYQGNESNTLVRNWRIIFLVICVLFSSTEIDIEIEKKSERNPVLFDF